MYNLEDLEKNLKTLIKQMRDIQTSMKQPISLKKKNSKSILVKMPKIILCSRLCEYLTMQEIHALSNTCSSLRNAIYGPIGWKILMRVKTPYPVKVVIPKSNLQLKFKKVAMQGSDFYEDDFEDQKFISQERQKFKKILIKKFEDYQQRKQKYQAHKEKVRIEKNQILKMKQQHEFFDFIRDQLKSENNIHKDQLKKISEGFQKKIQQMDRATDQLFKERTKLQNQKQALAGKVRQYQNEIQIIKEESQKSKQILQRLKSYLLFNEL